MVFPVYWMVSTAFKPGVEILELHAEVHPAPRDARATSRTRSTGRTSGRASSNSLIVVVVVTALSLVLAFLAALALAKFRFRGRRAFIVLIIGVQMVPLNALIIPLYILLSRAGQVDKLTGVIVTYLTFVLPFCVWTLRGFMLGVPRELEEAAMVDGCDALRRLRPDPAAARRAGPGRDLDLRLHPGLERVHHRLRAAAEPGEADAAPSGWPAFTTLPRHRLGRAHGRGDADRAPGRRLLRARAPADRRSG